MSKFIQSKDVAWNFLDDRIIAFNLGQERMFHTLNSTAAFIFDQMQAPRSREELIQALIGAFDINSEQATTDITAALAEMKSKRLISEV